MGKSRAVADPVGVEVPVGVALPVAVDVAVEVVVAVAVGPGVGATVLLAGAAVLVAGSSGTVIRLVEAPVSPGLETATLSVAAFAPAASHSPRTMHF